ncbi:unnamed protein product [Bemisia tabaci]|uniref:Uncharacterized protein n=1 Tax=Bemisia tabaci TaxID=7038 RepID=A0A9P0CF82_BEMTA|nr:unnamed protein product [Bemisia tabaci]
MNNISENPGLLSLELGPAQQRDTFHTFVHYYNISLLRKELTLIQNSYPNFPEIRDFSRKSSATGFQDTGPQGKGTGQSGGMREENYQSATGQGSQRNHKGEQILNMIMSSTVTPLARFFDSHLWLESHYRWMPNDQESLRQALKLAQYQISGSTRVCRFMNDLFHSLADRYLLLLSSRRKTLLSPVRLLSLHSRHNQLNHHILIIQSCWRYIVFWSLSPHRSLHLRYYR